MSQPTATKVLEPLFWILQPSRLAEVTGQAGPFYSYRVIAGGFANGQINKRFLDIQVEEGWARITHNPLEAYAWQCLLEAE